MCFWPEFNLRQPTQHAPLTFQCSGISVPNLDNLSITLTTLTLLALSGSTDPTPPRPQSPERTTLTGRPTRSRSREPIAQRKPQSCLWQTFPERMVKIFTTTHPPNSSNKIFNQLLQKRHHGIYYNSGTSTGRPRTMHLTSQHRAHRTLHCSRLTQRTQLLRVRQHHLAILIAINALAIAVFIKGSFQAS